MTKQEEIEKAINIERLASVLCKCGHPLGTHYFGEGCCDRHLCWCEKFEPIIGESKQ